MKYIVHKNVIQEKGLAKTHYLNENAQRIN